MPNIAIDIVLIPPPVVMALCIEWSRKLAPTGNPLIVLNETNVLPHVSLLMGCITGESISEARRALTSVAARHLPLRLDATGLRVLEGDNPVVALDIARTTGIQNLQEDIIRTFHPLTNHTATAADLFDPPPVSPSALTWINQFIKEQRGENFWPHITLGHGAPADQQPPFYFTATRIAVCHLGNHCTCRSVLAEAALYGT